MFASNTTLKLSDIVLHLKNPVREIRRKRDVSLATSENLVGLNRFIVEQCPFGVKTAVSVADPLRLI